MHAGSESTSAYLTVQSVSPDGISATCVVCNSCVLEGVQLTVHVGGMKNSAPILSEQDCAVLADFGVRNSIDFVALSFTRTAEDVREARATLDRWA
jgi:pyruvate kinase